MRSRFVDIFMGIKEEREREREREREKERKRRARLRRIGPRFRRTFEAHERTDGNYGMYDM